MAAYTIKGNCEEVCAKLKNTLAKQEAGFRASLDSMFNLDAQPAPEASADAGTTAPGGSTQLTRKDDDTLLRSRLRGSLRITV